jgi:hypothetical protein
MIKWTAAAVALAFASPAYAMPLAPAQQPDSMVLQVLEGCGPGFQILNGICVRNPDAREERREERRQLRPEDREGLQPEIHRCELGMRWVDGRCIQ